jgi:hypothetical protein
MDDLVHYIENWTDLPVVNRTALSGLFASETGGSWLVAITSRDGGCPSKSAKTRARTR